MPKRGLAWKPLRLAALLAFCWSVGSSFPRFVAAASDIASLDRECQTLDEAYRRQLTVLAERCDSLGLDEQARVTREWMIPRAPDRQYVFLVADGGAPEGPAAGEKTVQQWHDRFMEYRRAQAESLWDLARRYAKSDNSTRAYQLLHELLREDPDHAEARRVLGYRRVGKRWSDGSERTQTKSGLSPHPWFGWRRGAYWRVESAHFRVATNLNAKAGVALVSRLEDLHAVWRQLFFPFWGRAESLRKRIEGGSDRLAVEQLHELVLFRDREDYLAELGKVEPQIGVSRGYYAKGKRTAFFYAGDESLEPIWNHEVTHQLFQECGDSVPDPGETANVWILEGMAVYIESLVRHRGYCTVGGFEADRLQFARRAKLKGEFYLPLTQLVRLGREDLQKHPELARVYTQSAGLTHFLMNSRGGEFRNALTRYLLHVYRGSDDPDALAQAIGAPLADLDARYAEFLKVADEDLRNVQRVSPLYHLSLTGTSVTDAGLASLASTHLEQLQWLDLSFTKAGDPALLAFANAKKLKQAFLEATSITDRGLAALGSWPELEELDLSRTAITDEGLVHLEPLKKLRTLWLTGTQITDAAIPYLRRHVDLEWLDVGGTRISEGGLRQLRAALLKLRERTGAAKPSSDTEFTLHP